MNNNLKAFKCSILKGDYNHDKSNKWHLMDVETQNECLEYLESDVLGLKELYDKLNGGIFDKYKINASSYISTSSMTFSLWKHRIDGKFDIQLPNLEQEQFFRKSIRGGRVYPSKHRFKSIQYDSYINKECAFEDVEDYVLDADVVSLYPTAMTYLYPIGDCFKFNPPLPLKLSQRKNYFLSENHSILSKNESLSPRITEGNEGVNYSMPGKMGIYTIRYKTNKNLIHSIGGSRGDDGSLKWDLKDGEGVYTSIDIEDMIDNGYDIEIIDGYYWNETASVFSEYIKYLFEAKNAEAKANRKGSVNYLLCKLFMNALYGKTIQRPIFVESKIISSSSEYWKFWGTHIITSIEPLNDKWVVNGTSRDFRLSIIQGAKKIRLRVKKGIPKKIIIHWMFLQELPIFFEEINSLDVRSGTSGFNNRFEEYNRLRNNRFRNFQFRNWLLHYRQALE